MEFIYSISSIIFGFKFMFVCFLFILNMYLVFSYTHNDSPNTELQSGFGNNKKIKAFFNVLGGVGGFLSALITVKNEFRDIKLGNIKQLMEEERNEIRRSIDKDMSEHQRLINSIDNNREELFKLYGDRTKLIAQNDRLSNIYTNLKDKVISFKEKSGDDNIRLGELGVIDQLIKQDAKKFGEELTSVLLQIDPNEISSSSSSSSTDSIGENIKESSMLPFDLKSILLEFESLNGIKKIAVSMILTKSVVFSALISIIFIFYGNLLIEKYDIENKYPRIWKIIVLRQKYQKYYLNYYLTLVLLVIITEVSFALAILLL